MRFQFRMTSTHFGTPSPKYLFILSNAEPNIQTIRNKAPFDFRTTAQNYTLLRSIHLLLFLCALPSFRNPMIYRQAKRNLLWVKQWGRPKPSFQQRNEMGPKAIILFKLQQFHQRQGWSQRPFFFVRKISDLPGLNPNHGIPPLN
jgi:hypothetical protein